MLLQALSRIRGANVIGRKTGSDSGSSSSPFSGTSDLAHSSRQSSHSTATTATSSVQHESATVGGGSLSPSPSRSSKRNSNNMFGAGFRDRSYMRKQTARMTGSNRSVLSTTPSITTSTASATALIDSYATDTPLIDLSEENTTAQEGDNIPRAISPDDDVPLSPFSLQLPKQLSDSQMRRMSTSLERAIQEMEDEAEDQVLVPRTPINPNGLAYELPSSFPVTSPDVSHSLFISSNSSTS